MPITPIPDDSSTEPTPELRFVPPADRGGQPQPAAGSAYRGGRAAV